MDSILPVFSRRRVVVAGGSDIRYQNCRTDKGQASYTRHKHSSKIPVNRRIPHLRSVEEYYFLFIAFSPAAGRRALRSAAGIKTTYH